MFAERNEKAKKTKFELELIKIVHCFLDVHGNYDSNLASFIIESLQQTNFLLQLVSVTSNLKKNKMLVIKENSNQKVSFLVSFLNQIFTTCQICIKNFKTCKILKQKFHKVSDFKTKFLQPVRFFWESFSKIRFCTKMCIEKIKFWLNLPRKLEEFCNFCAFLNSRILTQKNVFKKQVF